MTKQVLVLAEHDNKQLKYSTLTTLTAALALSADITVLVAGYQCRTVAEQIEKLNIAKHILWVEAPYYQHELAEDLALLTKEVLCERAAAAIPGIIFTHLLAPASTFGKNVLPRVAAIMGMGQISDVLQIISTDTFVRPIYAGNAQLTVQSLDLIKIMTIRSTAFDPINHESLSQNNVGKNDATAEGSTAEGSTAKGSTIVSLSPSASLNQTKFLDFKQNISSRPDLSAAKIVISGGRGLQSRENFKMLEELADKLGAAIGASRAAVDAGYVPNDYQVGQTGKVVAPNLYIAVGISGAIQHISGMKESKVIVAINKDADAPIFQLADYGLVGDLFQIIPELNHEITIRKSNKVG